MRMSCSAVSSITTALGIGLLLASLSLVDLVNPVVLGGVISFPLKSSTVPSLLMKMILLSRLTLDLVTSGPPLLVFLMVAPTTLSKTTGTLLSSVNLHPLPLKMTILLRDPPVLLPPLCILIPVVHLAPT